MNPTEETAGKGIDAQEAESEPTQTEQASQTSDGVSDIVIKKSTLDERIERAKKAAAKKTLQELGFKDRTEFDSFKSDAIAALEAQKAQEREQMTAIEKLEADKRDLVARAEAAEALSKEEAQRAEAAQGLVILHREFAERGITNTDYALWQLAQAEESVGEDEEFDEQKFLDDLMLDPHQAAALGIETVDNTGTAEQDTEEVQVQTSERRPAQTVARKKGPAPKPKIEPKTKDAMTMTDEEWAAHLAAMNLYP